MTTSEIYKALATEIRTKRVNLRLSQEQVARYAGVTRTQVVRIETAFGNPSIGIISKVLVALDCQLKLVTATPTWCLSSAAGTIEQESSNLPRLITTLCNEVADRFASDHLNGDELTIDRIVGEDEDLDEAIAYQLDDIGAVTGTKCYITGIAMDGTPIHRAMKSISDAGAWVAAHISSIATAFIGIEGIPLIRFYFEDVNKN